MNGKRPRIVGVDSRAARPCVIWSVQLADSAYDDVQESIVINLVGTDQLQPYFRSEI